MISRTFPFSFMSTAPPSVAGREVIYANGIFADTGLPLCELSPASAVLIAKSSLPSDERVSLARGKYDTATLPSYGPIGEISSANLSEAGWGIIFPAGIEPKVKKGLQKLIEHRQREAGKLCKVFENDDGYQPGESCTEWLARHGASLMPVNPHKGVPFYLLIVGSPTEIPFEFQYLLDIYWGVGRLYFEDSDDYEKYAESVLDYERSGILPTAQSAAIFATSHEFDQATQMFASEVARPLIKGHDGLAPLGASQNFRLQNLIGEQATKENLTELLHGGAAGATPALLFTGAHGMGFRPNDLRLKAAQGALICQDWEGWGEVTSNHWFESREVPADARLHGLIHFMFACYSAGCPQFDDFVAHSGVAPDQIAPAPLIASLPQKFLAHPGGGALASIGHIDRAWSYSFHSSRSGPQVQSFRDVLGRLLKGERLGQATDQFDIRRAALSFELADALRALDRGKTIPEWEVASLWTARNDARNYIVLGDPAVRIRVEQFGRKAVPKVSPTTTDALTQEGHKDGDAATEFLTESRGKNGVAALPSSPANSKPNGQESANMLEERDVPMSKESFADSVPERIPLNFDLGNRPGTDGFHPELAKAWREHVKRSYERNEVMFDQLLKSFMQPYWTTVWMYRILFIVGVSGFVVAAVLGAWKGVAFGALFGGISVLAFLGYFIGRPLNALERNLMFITWLGLIYNTYWSRLSSSLNESAASREISLIQKATSRDLERLIAIHANHPQVEDTSEDDTQAH